VGLAPPIVIPAKLVLSKVEGAGIRIPYFTGEEIFAQILKLALDIGPQFEYSAHQRKKHRGFLIQAETSLCFPFYTDRIIIVIR